MASCAADSRVQWDSGSEPTGSMSTDEGRRAPPDLGARVKERRRQRGWTQQQLAERVDCSHTAISHIENGRRWPSFQTLRRLAEALQLDLLALHDVDVQFPQGVTERSEFEEVLDDAWPPPAGPGRLQALQRVFEVTRGWPSDDRRRRLLQDFVGTLSAASQGSGAEE